MNSRLAPPASETPVTFEGPYRLLVNGRLVGAAQQLEVFNPATGKSFASCPRADKALIEEAVEAASHAFPAWAALPIETRAQLIHELATQVERRVAQFARLLTLEQGKPLAQAEFEIAASVFTLKTFADWRLPPKVLRETAQGRITEHRLPLGVVAAITPWNFPVLLLINKLGPALLAGNTLVIKPAPTTPLTTLRLCELCAAIFPAGVINVVVDANDLGNVLTSHPAVAKVAFTGSTTTGRKVLASTASTIKRVTLELGGNDAAIVLDDVDPKFAAQQIFAGAMANAGQICVATKRAYVPASMYAEVCAELARLASAAKVGSGLDAGTEIGPIQNRAQFERLKELIADARENGTIIAGGEALKGDGYFIPPTIVRDLPANSRLVAEEQFGPVLPVLSYDDIDTVIAQVNESDFGLAGTVWGANLDRAESVARRIESGTVWVNQNLAVDPTVPFRGAKQSGLGGELGIEGLYEYTQARIVNSVHLPSASP